MKIWRFQRRVGYFLFGLFAVLLAANIAYPGNSGVVSATNTFLSVITGWIGIIMGFYFSKNMSSNLERRLRKAGDVSKDTDMQFRETAEKMQLIIKKEQERRVRLEEMVKDQDELITELISEINDNNKRRRTSKVKR
jgi:gas vesicle protein